MGKDETEFIKKGAEAPCFWLLNWDELVFCRLADLTAGAFFIVVPGVVKAF